jgi:hypothetical protein
MSHIRHIGSNVRDPSAVNIHMPALTVPSVAGAQFGPLAARSGDFGFELTATAGCEALRHALEGSS